MLVSRRNWGLALLLAWSGTIFPGCPAPFSQGGLTSGYGWSADLAIQGGVVHAGYYDLDAYEVRHATRRIGGDEGWTLETVDSFPLTDGPRVVASEGPSQLRIALDEDSAYLLYVGLGITGDDGSLDIASSTSVRLATREDDRWTVLELRPHDPSFGDVAVNALVTSGGKGLGIYSWRDQRHLGRAELFVLDGVDFVVKPLGESGKGAIPFVAEGYYQIVQANDSLLLGAVYRDKESGSLVATLVLFDPKSGNLSSVFQHPGGDIFPLSKEPGHLEALVQNKGREGTSLFLATSEDEGRNWSVKPVQVDAGAEYPTQFAVYVELVAYGGGEAFALVRRIDGGTINDHLVGVARLADDLLSVEWIDLHEAASPGAGVRLAVAGPYKAFSYVTTKTKDGTLKGPHGKRPYSNAEATLHVCISEGSAWSCEIVQ